MGFYGIKKLNGGSSRHHLEIVEVHILGTVHEAAFVFGKENMLENVRSDPLARSDDRDSRRIAHHEFAGHETDALFHGHPALRRVERLLRRHRDLRVDIFVIEKPGRIAFMQALDFRERGNKPLDIHHAVPGGKNRQQVADITEFYLYSVIVAEMVIDLDSRKSDVAGVDGKFRPVERENRVAVDELRTEREISAEIVDLGARVIGEVHRLLECGAPLEIKVSAGDIERGEQQIVRASRLRQGDYLTDVVGIDGFARKQYRTLRQRTARLMN